MPLVREVLIENYKSIRKLTLELGRVNVLIGANGSGKSNILEGIAIGSAGTRKALHRPDFLIYAPESSALRLFETEPQIRPLGIRGEGLFAHLKALSTPERADRLAAIGDRLTLLDGFEIPKDLDPEERSLLIREHYLAEGALLDQRGACQGFLFLLFYLTLFISDATPPFFAIDNVDASLNPKLVTTLVEQLVELARTHDKQVIFTTHNPAVLDGIDLGDDEQRLFVTERGRDGATRARRVEAPKPLDGDPPVALSEAFARGYLGGLHSMLDPGTPAGI
jgi:predicted ATPase